MTGPTKSSWAERLALHILLRSLRHHSVWRDHDPQYSLTRHGGEYLLLLSFTNNEGQRRTVEVSGDAVTVGISVAKAEPWLEGDR